ncbi:hypothetical protein BU26DRAFT_208745 [Trematosphaeria pertusa]|uniref:Uncharacterized protein n=1 Tax=Trematosphaeria pertusa TaxID=390896 RepID=A0A6A6IRQ4_9PLEO|nr:uncharacterized protein BU26DRAFT_208745 [Trematosphaeria pertusa]KAF2252758.1 hypothetical protein BU26DRAFT_208745 [Trematosphaeria pertusa]
MDHKTADLGSYIESSHYGHFVSFNRGRVFDQGITHLRPQLESDRTNRILLYPGCFNPPHRHEALLQHAFANSQDINIIAAIILPLDDDSIEAKCRDLGESLVFTKDQRVQLWRGYVPHDWYWVYDRSTREWDSFRRELTDAITRDGFDLRFVVLTGPDHLMRNSPPPWKAWDCEEIIVSDMSRSADFTNQRGPLGRLKDCESWEHVFWDDEEATRYATKVVASLAGGMSLLAPTTFREMLEKEPNFFKSFIQELHSEHASKVDTVRVSSYKIPRGDNPLYSGRRRHGAYQLDVCSPHNKHLYA